MGRSIHYEYSSGVEQHKRFRLMPLLATGLFLFGVSAATPRVLKRVFEEPTQTQLQTQQVEAPELEVPKPEEKPKETEVIVDSGLQKVIEQWAARHTEQAWGVSVERLGKDPIAARYQANERFNPGELYQVLLTQTLSEKLPSDQWNRRKLYDYRGAHTYLECADLMLRASDKACGEAIGNFLNWRSVDGRLGAIGLQNTKLNSRDQRFTSAGDMALYMRLLHDEPILSQQAQSTVMDALLAQKNREGIPAGSPNCKVYNKTGEIEGYLHDVAIVNCGSVSYTLAVMSKGGNYAQVAELARALNTYFKK